MHTGYIGQNTNLYYTSPSNTMHNKVRTLETFMNISDGEINETDKPQIKESLLRNYNSENPEIQRETFKLVSLLVEFAYSIDEGILDNHIIINRLIHNINQSCIKINTLTQTDIYMNTTALLVFVKTTVPNEKISNIFLETVQEIANKPNINQLGFKIPPSFDKLCISDEALEWLVNTTYKKFCDQDESNEPYYLSELRTAYEEQANNNITEKTQQTKKAWKPMTLKQLLFGDWSGKTRF